MAQRDADRIREHLFQRVEEERQAGRTCVVFRSGDIHRALALDNAYPNVCQVLQNPTLFHEVARVEHLATVHSPPSGQGANLIIVFRVLP